MSMEANTLNLSVTSDAALQEALDAVASGECTPKRYLSFAAGDPDIMVCPFRLPAKNARDIRNALLMEAVELLSLPAADIALDFQVLERSAEEVSGVYLCTPYSRVKNYLSLIKLRKMIPLKMTADIFLGINAFFKDHSGDRERLCLLDFTTPGFVNLSVIHDRQIDLVRRVPYEDDSEAVCEVIRSLRSACAQSREKGFDRIYFAGAIAADHPVVAEAGGVFAAKTEAISLDVNEGLGIDGAFLSLNLIRSVACSPRERRMALWTAHALLVLGILACAALFYQAHLAEKIIKQLSYVSNPLTEVERL